MKFMDGALGLSNFVFVFVLFAQLTSLLLLLTDAVVTTKLTKSKSLESRTYWRSPDRYHCQTKCTASDSHCVNIQPKSS